jgi:hypothetical protein
LFITLNTNSTSALANITLLSKVPSTFLSSSNHSPFGEKNLPPRSFFLFQFRLKPRPVGMSAPPEPSVPPANTLLFQLGTKPPHLGLPFTTLLSQAVV